MHTWHAGVVLGFVAVAFAARADSPRARFAWGTPCRVRATEMSNKDGNAIKVTFDVVVEPDARTDELRVRLDNYGFLEVNGQDATTPELRAALRDATAAASLVPAMRVTKTGEFLGVADLEQSINKIIENPVLKSVAQDAAQVREAMLSPQMLASFTNEMGAIWATWVGRWLEHRPAKGKRLELTEQVEIGQAKVSAPVTFSNLGEIAQGTIRLRTESTMRGKDMAGALREFVRGMAASFGAKPAQLDVFVDAERHLVMEVDTDPATLRPRRALFDSSLRLTETGGKIQTRQMRRETTFDWSHAQGACAPRRALR